MPIGFIDTAIVAATKTFHGELGTMAANTRMIAPIQEISGCTDVCGAALFQWNITPTAKAVDTR